MRSLAPCAGASRAGSVNGGNEEDFLGTRRACADIIACHRVPFGRWEPTLFSWAAFLVPQTVAIAMALSGSEPARNAQGPNWFQRVPRSSENLFTNKGYRPEFSTLTLGKSACRRGRLVSDVRTIFRF
jgi:hypothetical protein